MSKVNYNTTLGEMYEACPFVKHSDIDYEEGEILCGQCDFNSICAVFPDEWKIDMTPTKKQKQSDKVVINIYGNVTINHEREVKENDGE